MKNKMKWIMAFLITFSVVAISLFEKNGMMQTNIKEITSSGEDFVMLRNWTKGLLNPDGTTPDSITVTAPLYEGKLATFSTMQPFSNGSLLSYKENISIRARQDGLVIFTGHTQSLGKTMTIIYENGENVTYGFLDELTILPYTSIKEGETISNLTTGRLYLQVEKKGTILDSTAIKEWIK
ncbi:peptidoglycan DD-metalloendopeptidase family protein [Viridibacillus sp. YIM B01967]|uniref:Peptidoglycan DD-metalloendopeptidase family protein n=1 Tax=Viridibacillus soli TaxID=2798301 RepID=A0ABS1H1Z0_9BACL|nr:peptidoglycan DD-metalloendopeptidase family protein [Viridibacillus soli]MBK3493430.1 peptidoglycan DD-metalloendopeptidase family protein [Viridibacillus soli]